MIQIITNNWNPYVIKAINGVMSKGIPNRIRSHHLFQVNFFFIFSCYKLATLQSQLHKEQNH